jgi:hypothetical protein
MRLRRSAQSIYLLYRFIVHTGYLLARTMIEGLPLRGLLPAIHHPTGACVGVECATDCWRNHLHRSIGWRFNLYQTFRH